jgi:tetratricopeptide (TPR) repeat protein
MTFRIRFLLLRFIVLLTLALFLCRAPLAPARSDESHWIRVNSSHFSLVTDADDIKGHDVAARFEQMRAVFGQLLARTRINMSEPIDIIALRNDDEYSKVVPMRQGQGIGSGFFIPGEDRNYFVLNLSKDESWRAISRDFALVFLNCNYPPTQPWFDEGFAEYFSSLRFDNKQAQIGGDPDSFTELLNATAWLAIPDLLRASGAALAGQEGSRHTLFYAESWIVMHYLLSQNKLPETGTYLDLVENQHLSVEDAIQKAYGMSAGQFTEAVKDHFHALAQGGSAAVTPLPGVTPGDQIGSSHQELSFAEGQALLGEMTVRLPEHREQAVRELESITSQPKMDNVVARRGLAWAHLQKKEFDSAIEELNKGAELNSKDPWLHYYLALVRLRAGEASGHPTEGLSNTMQDLHMVLDWDPEFAQARGMLAMAQLEGGGTHAAMDSMRATIQLAPRSQTYLLDMADIYMAGKSWDAATALLDRLKASTDPQIAKSATDLIEALPTLKKYGVLPQPEAGSQTRGTASPSTLSPPASSSSTPRNQAPPAMQPQSPEADEASVDHTEQIPAPPQPDKRPIQFLKGKIVSVDCSQAPSAILTVSTGAKVLKLRTENYKSLMVMGADNFSCDWKSRLVAVNYRPGGKADGDLVSLELE